MFKFLFCSFVTIKPNTRFGYDERFNKTFTQEKIDNIVTDFQRKQLLDQLTSPDISTFDKLKLIKHHKFLLDP